MRRERALAYSYSHQVLHFIIFLYTTINILREDSSIPKAMLCGRQMVNYVAFYWCAKEMLLKVVFLYSQNFTMISTKEKKKEKNRNFNDDIIADILASPPL